MTPTIKGGAKLGHGLVVEDGALSVRTTDPTDAGPIVALSAKGWAEQDTTVGKNLLNLTRQVDGTSVYAMNVSDASVNNQMLSLTANGANPYLGRVTSAGDSYASNCGTLIPVEPNTTYFLSWTNSAFNQMYYTEYDESKVSLGFSYRTSAGTITTKADTRYLTMRIGISNATSGTTYSTAVQLELGSTATSYEPYSGGAPSPSPSYPQEIRRVTGHTISGKTGRFVDILVTHDGTTTTIPIPLPERGWVAALPDGTCDTLTLDGAGGYVWELRTGMLDLADLTWQYYTSTSSTLAPFFFTRLASNDIVAYDGNFSNVVYPALAEDFVFTRRNASLMTDGRIVFDGNVTTGDVAQIQCKMTDISTVEDFVAALGDSSLLLYKAAVPITEQGYVDMPTVPVHATLTTDLHDLTVRCCADEGAAEIASAWYNRAYIELSDAIVDLAERVSKLEG